MRTTALLPLMAALGLAGVLAACGPDANAGVATADRPLTVVDSVLPVDEEIRRFRATIGDSVAELSGGANSRDELVGRFTAALAAGDSVTLSALLVTPEEFAYLYYPNSTFAQPPYQLSPGLVWFQLRRTSDASLRRTLAAYAGSEGTTEQGAEHGCDDPTAIGPGQLWEGCVIQTDTPAELGPILEWGGRHKFLSFSH